MASFDVQERSALSGVWIGLNIYSEKRCRFVGPSLTRPTGRLEFNSSLECHGQWTANKTVVGVGGEV